jgi:hypothetical protein
MKINNVTRAGERSDIVEVVDFVDIRVCMKEFVELEKLEECLCELAEKEPYLEGGIVVVETVGIYSKDRLDLKVTLFGFKLLD